MIIQVFKSKIHRATVTGADINYEGSISIDTELVALCGMHIHEKVDIYNINNGNRLSTYIIAGKKGEVCLNGAAARLVNPGDKIIIVAYAMIEENTIANHHPKVVVVDDQNNPKEVLIK